MVNKAENVTVGKPKPGGAVFAAPKGTEAPTDGTAALAPAFVNLGFINEDGYTSAYPTEYAEFKGWDGSTILKIKTSSSENTQIKFIEVKPDVLKLVYGADNVEVNESGDVAIKSKGDEADEMVYVIEEILTGGRIMRTVIPRGQVGAPGDVVHKSTELLGYDMNIEHLPDADQVRAYIYIAEPAADPADDPEE